MTSWQSVPYRLRQNKRLAKLRGLMDKEVYVRLRERHEATTWESKRYLLPYPFDLQRKSVDMFVEEDDERDHC